MRILSEKALKDFWRVHPDAEDALKAWYQEAFRSSWHNPAEIKKLYANASIIAGDRIVFNIKGNKYRLIVKVRYDKGIIFIRFVGTHAEYDKVDARTV